MHRVQGVAACEPRLERVDEGRGVGPHLVHRPRAVDGGDQTLVLVVLEHRRRLVSESGEALADRSRVVVGAARRLSALEQPLLHHLLGAVEDQHGRDSHRAARLPLPARQVVCVAREAVDQEAAAAVCAYGVEQQLDGHLDRDNLALADVLVDHLPLRRARRSLRAQQVARRQVHVPVLLHDPSALRPFAGTRAAEHKDDRRSLVSGCRSGEELGAKEAGQLDELLHVRGQPRLKVRRQPRRHPQRQLIHPLCARRLGERGVAGAAEPASDAARSDRRRPWGAGQPSRQGSAPAHQ
mmetsp:Transcript_10458/g.33595  ORF Transcript_10458/g.33595 Transcript_10458/m.33595 type:complete len:296 (+) Transcript_10458:537-1424(+)